MLEFGCCLREFAVTLRWSILKAPLAEHKQCHEAESCITEKQLFIQIPESSQPTNEKWCIFNVYVFLQVHFERNFKSKSISVCFNYNLHSRLYIVRMFKKWLLICWKESRRLQCSAPELVKFCLTFKGHGTGFLKMSDQADPANSLLLQILSNLGVNEMSSILLHTKHAVKFYLCPNISTNGVDHNAPSCHSSSATTVNMTRPVILTNHASP